MKTLIIALLMCLVVPMAAQATEKNPIIEHCNNQAQMATLIKKFYDRKFDKAYLVKNMARIGVLNHATMKFTDDVYSGKFDGVSPKKLGDAVYNYCIKHHI